MLRKHIWPLLGIIFLCSCASGLKSLQQGDYFDAVTKAVNRLSNDPANRKATQVLSEGYPLAIAFYQEELDHTLMANGAFKWSRALDIMLTVNQLSDQIRRVPAARKIVPSPKTYVSELADVQARAAQEYYDAGTVELARKTRESARQAYSFFKRVDELVPGFKDAYQKMKFAKEEATMKVVVEQIPVNGRYEYSAKFFYDNVLQMLEQRFPDNSFVRFVSSDDAGKMHPDLVLQMGFYDFFIDRPQHFEEQHALERQVEEKYQVKISKDTTVTRTRLVTKKGKIKIVTDQMASGGLLDIKAVDFQTKKVIFTDRVPGNFSWQNKYGVFVGDQEVLDKELIKIVNNRALTPPPPQDMFVLFTKPIFDQLSGKLVNYFSRYN